MGVKLAAASGGSVELVPTNTASNYTLTLPASTSTVLTTTTPGIAISGPAFSVYATVAVSATSSVFTKVLYNTEVFDTANNFDTATNRFTPTVAGYYQFNATASFSANASSGQILVSLYKNGARALDGALLSQSTTLTLYSSVSGIIYCNGSTDYIEVYAYQSTAGSMNIGGGTAQQLFTGAMIRSA